MTTPAIDATDRMIVRATQAGLPLVPRPYHEIARQTGTSVDEVRERLQRLLDMGVIRRIGVVPNHYALGMTANAMTVWDVDDGRLPTLGPRVGSLAFVSHCYERPRRPPHWPFNLFAMIHGRTRREVDEKIAAIAGVLGSACIGHDVLLSSRILKKTGLRLTA